MFKTIKLLFYLLLIAGGAFAYWFMPKYSFIKKNPNFCSKLVNQIYYCGPESKMDSMFISDN